MIKGIVEAVSNKGRATNFLCNGEWYGFGFDEAPFVKGDTVEFDFEQRGRFKNVVKGSCKVVTGDAPAAGKSNGGGGSGRNNDTQVAIQYQASRKDALEFVGVLLSNGVSLLPAKKGDQYDAALALVDDLTYRFYNDTTNAVQHGVPEDGVPAASEQSDDMFGDE